MRASWQEPQDLLQHLNHLRWMIIRSLTGLLVATGFGLFYARTATLFITVPVGGPLVVLGITEAFFVQLKVGLAIGIVTAGPFILWQVWKFVSPGLTERERAELRLLVPCAYLLFLLGTTFAFWVVIPQAIRFFRSMAGEQWRLFLSLGQYLSFALGVALPFGLAFEAPLLFYVAARLRWISSHSLRKSWRQVILGIFIVAAFLTPGPDPMTQLLMALPMLLLWQLCLAITQWVEKHRSQSPSSEQKPIIQP